MTFSASDDSWMRRALELAQRGRFTTWPNPRVGCVVVEGNVLLGEGWHATFGEGHAEVRALSQIAEDRDLSEATVFVTLEPCSHTGKTPPCADLLVRRGVGRVVVAMTDPNPRVAGSGIARLRQSGIQVDVGCLEHEAREMNRRFVHAMTSDTPWVTLKWAQSSDGFMDPELRAKAGRGGHALTGDAAARHTHALRATHDGILVGMNTWRVDRPRLDTRHVPGRDPRRFVVTRGQTPCPSDVTQHDLRSAPLTLLHPASVHHSPALESWRERGATLLPLDAPAFSLAWWKEFRAATSVSACLVEGGAEVAQGVLEHKTWNEIHVLEAPPSLTQGLPSPTLDLATVSRQASLGVDVLYVWRNSTTSSIRH